MAEIKPDDSTQYSPITMYLKRDWVLLQLAHLLVEVLETIINRILKLSFGSGIQRKKECFPDEIIWTEEQYLQYLLMKPREPNILLIPSRR
jgi:hypothetical protein